MEKGIGMNTTATIVRFGLAFVIGILVGLQREYAYKQADRELFAGARTLALIALAGCAAALLSDLAGMSWIFIAAFLAVSGLIGFRRAAKRIALAPHPVNA